MTNMTGGLTSNSIAQGIRDDRARATAARWAASEPAKWNEPTPPLPLPAPVRPVPTPPVRPVRPETRAQIEDARHFIDALQNENLGQLPPNLINALTALSDAIEMVADDADARSDSHAESGDTVGSSWSNRLRVG